MENDLDATHRRFTLVGGGWGALRGDPEGMWTTYRHLEEKVAAERARIRAALLAEFAEAGWIERHATDMRAIIDRIVPEEG